MNEMAVLSSRGALQTGLDIEHSRASIGFTWQGFDEMDEVADDGSIETGFAFRNGDKADLTARRNSSSTAC